jgi:putative transcriptional regulator
MAKRKVFEQLKQALTDSLAYERGQAVDLRTTEIPAPAKRMTPTQIKQIRLALHASQIKFARLINVSANTVESWEQGVRQPRDAALKLLTIARAHPRVLLEEVSSDQSSEKTSRSRAHAAAIGHAR